MHDGPWLPSDPAEREWDALLESIGEAASKESAAPPRPSGILEPRRFALCFGAALIAVIIAGLTWGPGVLCALHLALLAGILAGQLRRPFVESITDSDAARAWRQFRRGTLALWLAWLLLYAWLIAAPWLELDADRGWPRAVSEVLNLLSGLCLHWLFVVLDRPTVGAGRATAARCLWIYAPVTLWVVAVAAGWLPVGPEWIVVGAVMVSVSTMFFVARLGSHLMSIPRYALAPLFVFAAIQPLWASLLGPDAASVTVVLLGVALMAKGCLFAVLTAAAGQLSDYFETQAALERFFAAKGRGRPHLRRALNLFRSVV